MRHTLKTNGVKMTLAILNNIANTIAGYKSWSFGNKPFNARSSIVFKSAFGGRSNHAYTEGRIDIIQLENDETSHQRSQST